MNGELLHLAEQVIFVKTYKKTAYLLDSKLGYVDGLQYTFYQDAAKRLRKHTVLLEDTKSWIKRLGRLGLTDIGLRIREDPEDINLIAFSNGFRDCVIETKFKDATSVWIKNWTFDSAERMWDVSYTERPLKEGSFPEIAADPTMDFRAVLLKIHDLAGHLGLEWFAERFQSAEEILMERALSNCPYNEMPPKNRRMFSAAQTAYVFGGMGSWNDSPPYLAGEKGLADEYVRLTNELFRQIMRALMYAVNEWQ